VGAVGIAIAIEVERRVLGPLQRVFGLVAPLVAPHHEDLDGRFVCQTVVHPLEPVVEPAQG